MAKEKDQAKLEKPTADAPGVPESVVFVMPPEFLDGKKAVLRQSSSVGQSSQPGGITAPPLVASTERRFNKFIVPGLIVLVAILLIGGTTAFLLTRPGSPSTPNAPVCGNGSCESGETFQSCAEDCTAPGPICGNYKCETGETYQICAVDCLPPTAVCGNSQCEADETWDSCSSDCQKPVPVCGDNKCEEESEDWEVCPSDCTRPEPVAGSDLDSDGLTDREEVEIYGSNARETDSDRDSFIDINEILNMFDPARPQPGMLRDNPGITVFDNTAQGYVLLRPASWSVEENGEGVSSVTFAAENKEKIVVTIEEKGEDENLLSWYLERSPGVKPNEVTTLTTKIGNEMVQSPDKLSAYVAHGSKVVVLKYHLAKEQHMNYRTTFLMMVQSLELNPGTFVAPEIAAEVTPVTTEETSPKTATSEQPVVEAAVNESVEQPTPAE